MRLASRRNVQRPRPSGGAVQASAIRWAPCAPSSFLAYIRLPPRYGLSAAAMPSSTKRCRTRCTVATPAPTAEATRSSD